MLPIIASQQDTKQAIDSTIDCLKEMSGIDKFDAWASYFLECVECEIGENELERIIHIIENRQATGRW